jgi:hypothetical protein
MLFIPFVLSNAKAQQFTNWQNHTNMKVVKDLVISEINPLKLCINQKV